VQNATAAPRLKFPLRWLCPPLFAAALPKQAAFAALLAGFAACIMQSLEWTTLKHRPSKCCEGVAGACPHPAATLEAAMRAGLRGANPFQQVRYSAPVAAPKEQVANHNLILHND